MTEDDDNPWIVVKKKKARPKNGPRFLGRRQETVSEPSKPTQPLYVTKDKGCVDQNVTANHFSSP